MKRALKIIGLMLALPLLLIVGLALWAGFKVITGAPTDDTAQIASKAAYLRQIAAAAPGRHDVRRPNIVILLYDDLGYGDLGFTGSTAIRTPNIDALAARGLILSNYRSASSVCSPSRAGMLTGRLPPRAGVPDVFYPSSSPLRFIGRIRSLHNGLPPAEITLGDVLKADGYRTGMIGKWHLGDAAPSLPNAFGFDSFYGVRYSNDMKPFAIYRDAKVEVAAPADQTRLDALYTQEAVAFIAKSAPGSTAPGAPTHADAPFLLYFAHNFPHIPLAAPRAAQGRSAAGLYGDVVESLDDGVGRIVAALAAAGQLDNTIIILTSDNGPWYQGSPGHQRGRKGQSFEGGMRVPMLIHWPAGLAGNRTVAAATMGTDILPTLVDWLGLPLPADRIIDGTSMRPALADTARDATPQTTPHLIYYYAGSGLMAVSDGRFKYHVAQPYNYVLSNSRLALPTRQGPWLFDLGIDPDESYDVAMKYPAIAAQLKAAVDARNSETASNPRGWLNHN